MAAESSSTNQVRVMLWSPPRCLSTVFQKCMSYVDDIQIINEPYQSAAANNHELMKQLTPELGPEVQESFKKFMATAERQELSGNLQEAGWDDSICTTAWVKNLLEGQFPGKKVVFAKDLIYGIRGQFHMIPKGYKHTFIIRNPTKMTISLRKNAEIMFPPPKGQQFSMRMCPPLFKECYQPLLQLIEYLKENKEQTGDPIIIDADDLQNHPASIVRQYCDAVGIPYNDSLLEWPAGNECVKKNWLVSKMMLQGDRIIGYYAAAFASTKFLPSKLLPPENEIPADVIEFAKFQEPFYKKLYDMRIKP
ncbi:uncharacterized protein [Amphiura filiformis]|uniref:uncharacterized protein n=1 Tax=Amphiura filiformis TaxID=82378 RepID=UPI003B220B98